MNRIARRTAAALWRHRGVLMFFVVLGSAFAGWQLRTWAVSNSLESWYPEDDPLLAEYREFQQAFGNDEIVVLAVDAPDDLTFDSAAGIELVAELTDLLLDVDGVANVTSLVTVPQSLADARGRLMSADRRTTALVVQAIMDPDFESRRHGFLDAIRGQAEALELEPRLGGYGVVFDALNEASTTGAANLIAIAHLAMAAMLWIFYRRALPVAATIVSVSLAVTWTMALYLATGHQLNMVTMVLPTLVLVIGTADCMHIMRAIAGRSGTPANRAVRGLASVIGPCFLTTATTAAGFLGLTVSNLPVISQLGWFGAAGMLAAFASAVVVVPFLCAARLPALPTRRWAADRFASGCFEFAAARPRSIVGLFAVITVASGIALSGLKADTDSIGYLDAGHRVRQDSDYIEARLGPYVPVEFVVSADESLLVPRHLAAIRDWQVRAMESTAAGWSWSVVDALADDDALLTDPASRLDSKLARLRRFSPLTLRSMVSADGQLRVTFGAPLMSARSVQSLVTDILSVSGLPDGVTVRPAGYAPLYTRIVDEVVNSQLTGFLAAATMVLMLLALALKSAARWLLAVPANAVPVIVTLGLMGAAGIPLDVATATIASVVFGLVVDDTVHLLRGRPGGGLVRSLRGACGRSGGTLLATTVILTVGFLLLGLADIRSIAWFGLLAAAAVSVAIATDLLLLPAIAHLMPRRRASSAAP